MSLPLHHPYELSEKKRASYRVAALYLGWAGYAIWVLVCLLGCSGPTNNNIRVPSPTGPPKKYPESALSALSPQALAQVYTVSTNVVVPEQVPVPEGPELRKIYSDWYRLGFAFAYVTGVKHLRDWGYRSTVYERAKIAGWYDGNSAGALARREADLNAAFGNTPNR